MTPETARCFGLMLAAQARIEGMKAANAVVDAQAYPLPYGKEDFDYEAIALEQLAVQVVQQ